MRLSTIQRKIQWNRCLAYLYYREHRTELAVIPFDTAITAILKEMQKGEITVTPKCMFDAACHSSALVLHHKDGNENNDSLENISILCRSCNAKKRNWGEFGHARTKKHDRGGGKRYSIEVEGIELPIDSFTMFKSIKCGGKIMEFLDKYLKNGECHEYNEVMNGAAKHAGCSQKLVKRILDRETNKFNGDFETFPNEDEVKMIKRKKAHNEGEKSSADHSKL